MAYLSFRGVKTDTLGLYIEKMPSHKRAALRVQEFSVPGRDGALHIAEGYAPFDLQTTVFMVEANANLRQTVNAWADGTGKLYTSDDPTHSYLATVIKEVVYTRRKYGGKYYDAAKITFRCQPFMVETNESVNTLTENASIANLGNVPSLPIITVTGSGNCSFSIGEQTVLLEGVTSPVTLDCEAGYVYSSGGAAAMTGDFPSVPLGITQVQMNENITQLKIQGKWRWL